MANFFKNLFGTGDDNEGFVDYEDDGYDTSSSAVTEEEAGYGSGYSSSSYMSSNPAPRAINIHNGFSSQSKITIMKPTDYEKEVMQDIIERVQEGTIIFLNLTTIGHDMGLRVVDFITGAAAMCGGRAQKVQEYCYAVAPKNVDWVGIIED